MLYKYLPTDKLFKYPITAGLEPILTPGVYFVHIDDDGEPIIWDDGQFHGIVVPLPPDILEGSPVVFINGLRCYVVEVDEPLHLSFDDAP